MGCLNDQGQFPQWIGNIHLSGPCNRSCYYCIGQHMMALNGQNNLDTWPLAGLEEFVDQCNARGISRVYLTGSNTDPLLYQHIEELERYLIKNIEQRRIRFGLRTNGALLARRWAALESFDSISVSITSFDAAIYMATMGQGQPPTVSLLCELAQQTDLTVNIVLCPEIVEDMDILWTLETLATVPGLKRVNLREPYGQELNPARYPSATQSGHLSVIWKISQIGILLLSQA